MMLFIALFIRFLILLLLIKSNFVIIYILTYLKSIQKVEALIQKVKNNKNNVNLNKKYIKNKMLAHKNMSFLLSFIYQTQIHQKKNLHFY